MYTTVIRGLTWSESPNYVIFPPSENEAPNNLIYMHDANGYPELGT